MTATVGAAVHHERVLFAQLAVTSADVAATRSRLAKRAVIAAALRVAAPADLDAARPAQPSELFLVVTYLSGSLRQRRTGVGWASLNAVPPPVDTASLTVHDVDAAFEEIATI